MTYSSTPNVAIKSSPAKEQSTPNRKIYFVLVGGALVALMGGMVLRLMHSSQTQGAVKSDLGIEAELTEQPIATFETPFFQASPAVRLANPGLLQSTSSQSRVEAVTAGRPDPFAPLVVSSRIPARPALATVPTPPPPAITAAPNLPVVPVAATQNLPPLPQALPLPSLPAPYVPGSLAPSDAAIAVAPTPTPVFQSLVEQVTVSGVVQVGNSVSAIVTEPGGTIGRRVSPGDTVAGGRIRVKAIDLSGVEPVVVLTYDGRDYPRTVGSAALVGSL